MEQAGKNGAPEDVVEVLQSIPNQEHETAADVAKGTGLSGQVFRRLEASESIEKPA